MNFSSLDLAPELAQALEACGYSKLTPVQEKAIVAGRRGKDLLAIAQTGTGKTAAYALPVLQQLLDKARPAESNRPRALVLTPTRELAEQLANTIGGYAQCTELRITSAYGGVKMGGQAAKLRAGIDLLIATPGRLLEHVAQGNVNLSSVQHVVLDECDRMLDMGFIADVQSLLHYCNDKRQTMMFSATMSPSVNELSHKLLNKHQEIRISKDQVTADTVDHVLYAVDEDRKIDLFMDLLRQHDWYQILVFTSTKRQADELALKLKKYRAALCHGDKSQGSRRRALADFKSGKLQVLIATEVAARGLDIQGLEHVLNYNLPFLAEDYVHRIGRTGRAGAKGHATSFVSREEEHSLAAIEKLIGQRIKRLHRRGFEATNRQALIKRAGKNAGSRSNKATQTKIATENDKGYIPRTAKPSKIKPKRTGSATRAAANNRGRSKR